MVEEVLTRAEKTAGALLAALCAFGGIHAQTRQPTEPEQPQTTTATSLSFEVVSVKPAQPGTPPIVPAFMRDNGARILGLQRMAAPLSMLIGYAYHMQRSEGLDAFRKQPEWVRSRVYTVTFQAQGEPTRDQVREMMRTMLTEQFSLQIHEFTREGTVNRLVMSKPGVLGPNIKPHTEEAPCSTQAGVSLGNAVDQSNPSLGHCGFTFYELPGMVSHVGITDTTIAGAAQAIAGLGVSGLEIRPLVDATGLIGKYDLTLEYRSHFGIPLTDSEEDDGGVPTLVGALQQQLGMRVESGKGPVRMVVIDHLSEPTPD